MYEHHRPMAPPPQSPAVLPDVAHHHPSTLVGTLDRVGMEGIEVAIRLPQPDGSTALVPGRAAAYVSLDDATAKGIHMSRLYLALTRGLEGEPLSLGLLGRIVDEFLASHRDLSREARLAVSFDLLVRRPALASGHLAWRTYPARLEAERSGSATCFRLAVEVAYSSTCPCSAALARQLVQERFRADFAQAPSVDPADVAEWLGRESSIVATPHAQRSRAEITIALADDGQGPWFTDLIDRIEEVLQTPVQAAVKRADEQEFARRNAHNLMFAEDAARRIAAALEADRRISDWRCKVVHLESLHPHDAVAVATKGVAGGLTAG